MKSAPKPRPRPFPAMPPMQLTLGLMLLVAVLIAGCGGESSFPEKSTTPSSNPSAIGRADPSATGTAAAISGVPIDGHHHRQARVRERSTPAKQGHRGEGSSEAGADGSVEGRHHSAPRHQKPRLEKLVNGEGVATGNGGTANESGGGAAVAAEDGSDGGQGSSDSGAAGLIQGAVGVAGGTEERNGSTAPVTGTIEKVLGQGR